MTDDLAKLQRMAKAAQAFRPSAPIDRYAMLAGRRSQLMDIVSALGQSGQHVALYGERGVGKTSLANILAEIFDGEDLPNYRSAGVNCHSEDSFTSLWRNVFRELEIESPGEDDDLSPEDIRHRLARLDPPALIVVDELDRMEDDDGLTLLADTIKTLSDHVVESTLVLVGVARSIEDLIGEHESVERALVQVEMPRMSLDELREIIEKGCAYAGITAAPRAITKITMLSEGLPHFTHLLGYFASQRAISDDRTEITLGDVNAAVDQAVERHTIRSDYRRATRSTRADTLYPPILLACALAQKDALGAFAAGAIRDPLETITGKRYDIPAFAPHLKKLLQPERGSVLQRDGEPRRYFYRFANPLLQPYVILHGLSEGLITDEAIERLQGTSPTDDSIAPEPLF